MNRTYYLYRYVKSFISYIENYIKLAEDSNQSTASFTFIYPKFLTKEKERKFVFNKIESYLESLNNNVLIQGDWRSKFVSIMVGLSKDLSK